MIIIMHPRAQHETPTQWVARYCMRRDAIELMFAIHWYGRVIGRWLAA